MSVSLLNYVLSKLGPDQPRPLGGNTGLPAGAIECLEHNLVLATTAVTEPLFDAALMRFAQASRRDVALIRHGFYPEAPDPVRVDVAVRTIHGPILIRDMSFFRHVNGGLHLLPVKPDLFVMVNLFGLDLSMIPPWNRWDERNYGLERAAGEIARTCRSTDV